MKNRFLKWWYAGGMFGVMAVIAFAMALFIGYIMINVWRV